MHITQLKVVNHYLNIHIQVVLLDLTMEKFLNQQQMAQVRSYSKELPLILVLLNLITSVLVVSSDIIKQVLKLQLHTLKVLESTLIKLSVVLLVSMLVKFLTATPMVDMFHQFLPVHM